MSSAPLLPDEALPPLKDLFAKICKAEQYPQTESEYHANTFMKKLLTSAANNRQELQDAVQEIRDDLRDGHADEKLVEELTCSGGKYSPKKSMELTDNLAQLIYLAPSVAGEVFDMFLKPCDNDASWRLLEMKGIFMNDPMMAVYTKHDPFKDQQDGSDPEGFYVKQVKERIKWISDPNDPNVYEVNKYKCIIPNIIDLDIIQALAFTNHVQIFAKKSVQAILYAGWNRMMVKWEIIQSCLTALDLVVLLGWGMTTAGGTPFDRLGWTSTHNSTDDAWLHDHGYPPDAWSQGDLMNHVYAYNSPRHVPTCWNVLAASALRQVIDLAYRTWWFREKRKATEKRDTKAFRLFWSKKAYFHMIASIENVLLFWKIFFLWLVYGITEEVMTSAEQAILCATFFFTMLTLFAPIRVVASRMSLSLVAITKAAGDESVTHFVGFFGVFFTFFILAWEMVDRESTFLSGWVMGFRGFIVGDGDGLDFLGLKTDDETVQNEEAHKFKAAFGLLGMIVFFTYLMQLLIAIFSSTYETACKEAWLHFHQKRAQKMRYAVLGLHKFAHNNSLMNLLKHAELDQSLYDYVFWIGLVIFLLTLIMQVGVHYVAKRDFYWLFNTCTFMSVSLLTFGAILLEAFPFMWKSKDDDWFPRRDESHDTRHYLYIFCRKDYEENTFLGDDQKELDMQTVLKKLEDLSKDVKTIKDIAEKKSEHA